MYDVKKKPTKGIISGKYQLHTGYLGFLNC